MDSSDDDSTDNAKKLGDKLFAESDSDDEDN